MLYNIWHLSLQMSANVGGATLSEQSFAPMRYKQYGALQFDCYSTLTLEAE